MTDEDGLERDHRRAIADVISTLEDKAWRQGWLIGVATGVAVVAILLGLARAAGIL